MLTKRSPGKRRHIPTELCHCCPSNEVVKKLCTDLNFGERENGCKQVGEFSFLVLYMTFYTPPFISGSVIGNLIYIFIIVIVMSLSGFFQARHFAQVFQHVAYTIAFCTTGFYRKIEGGMPDEKSQNGVNNLGQSSA